MKMLVLVRNLEIETEAEFSRSRLYLMISIKNEWKSYKGFDNEIF